MARRLHFGTRKDGHFREVRMSINGHIGRVAALLFAVALLVAVLGPACFISTAEAAEMPMGAESSDCGEPSAPEAPCPHFDPQPTVSVTADVAHALAADVVSSPLFVPLAPTMMATVAVLDPPAGPDSHASPLRI